jgi:hypothetical protein
MQGRHLLLGALHSLAGAADLLLSCTRLRQGGRARVQGPGRRAGPAPRVQGAAALGCHLQARASARSARLPRAHDGPSGSVGARSCRSLGPLLQPAP